MSTLSNTVLLDPTKTERPDLILLGDRCSRLWNAANYICRQKFIAKLGVPRTYDLQQIMGPTDEYRQLPSDISQEVITKEQSHLAPTRGKGDGKHPPHSRAISLLYGKRKARLRHAMTCMAKEIAEQCLTAGVTHVYIGWPKGILRNRSYGSKWNDRIHGFWSFALTIVLLDNALAALGINASRVGERGSSSTCPEANCRSTDVVRKPRERLRCRTCGSAMHSDQAGSRNILISNRPSVRWDGPEAGPRTETRRWDHHRWTSRSANPSDQAAHAA